MTPPPLCFPSHQTFPGKLSERAASRQGFDHPEPSVWVGGERVFGFCCPSFVRQLPGLNRVRALAPAGCFPRRGDVGCGAGHNVLSVWEREAGRANRTGFGLAESVPLPSPLCSLADIGGFLPTNSHHRSCVPASDGGKRAPKSSRAVGPALLPNPSRQPPRWPRPLVPIVAKARDELHLPSRSLGCRGGQTGRYPRGGQVTAAG